jgi:hypothetical protein
MSGQLDAPVALPRERDSITRWMSRPAEERLLSLPGIEPRYLLAYVVRKASLN